MSRSFILETDVSLTHVGAVLMQINDDNLPRVIGYFFKKLRPTEMRYSTTDREALAIVLACSQFSNFLWGTKVFIRTNHQPLISVFRQKSKSPRMNRWILEMRDYQFTIDYKSGIRNVVADQLSRRVRPIRHWGDQNELFLGKTREEFSQLQMQEPRWREMRQYLGGCIPRSKHPRATFAQFNIENEILYSTIRKKDNTTLYTLVIPNELRQQAINFAHERVGSLRYSQICSQGRRLFLLA